MRAGLCLAALVAGTGFPFEDLDTNATAMATFPFQPTAILVAFYSVAKQKNVAARVGHLQRPFLVGRPPSVRCYVDVSMVTLAQLAVALTLFFTVCPPLASRFATAASHSFRKAQP
jgi:hypothetical protein